MIYKDIQKLNQDLPQKGRLMGLDVGTKTIGVAISDASWIVSNPKLTIKRQSNQKDFLVIKKIIEENSIKAIVVGLPLNMDGSESKMSEFVRKFADNLDMFLQDFKIIFFDERLSSFAAEEIMLEAKTKNNQKKKLIDQIAASVILQGALDNISISQTN